MSQHSERIVLCSKQTLLDDHSRIVIYVDFISFLVVDLIKDVVVKRVRFIIEVLKIIEVRDLMIDSVCSRNTIRAVFRFSMNINEYSDKYSRKYAKNCTKT